MKNKTKAFIALSATAALVTVGIASNKTTFTQTMGASGYARQMVFNSLYRNVVTSNGNTFSAFWVEEYGDSSFSGGLATLCGTGSFVSSTQTFNSYSSILGIKGDYDISNISSIEITYSIKTIWTKLIFGTLTEDNDFVSKEEVGVVNGSAYDATRTYTIEGLNSVHGLGFTLKHHATGGSNKDPMTAIIEKVIINYTC